MTSRAAGNLRFQQGRKMSAGREQPLGMREGTSSRGERAAERAEAQRSHHARHCDAEFCPHCPHIRRNGLQKESHVLLHTEHEASGGAMGMPSQYLREVLNSHSLR